MTPRHHFSQTGIVLTEGNRVILNGHVRNVNRTYTPAGWMLDMEATINGTKLQFSVPAKEYSKVTEWLPRELGAGCLLDSRYADVVREAIDDMSRPEFKLVDKTGFYTESLLSKTQSNRLFWTT